MPLLQFLVAEGAFSIKFHSLEMSRAFPELKEIDKPARAEVLKLAKDIRKAGSVL